MSLCSLDQSCSVDKLVLYGGSVNYNKLSALWRASFFFIRSRRPRSQVPDRRVALTGCVSPQVTDRDVVGGVHPEEHVECVGDTPPRFQDGIVDDVDVCVLCCWTQDVRFCQTVHTKVLLPKPRSSHLSLYTTLRSPCSSQCA